MTDLTVSEAASLLRRFDDVLILTHVRPESHRLRFSGVKKCADATADGI